MPDVPVVMSVAAHLVDGQRTVGVAFVDMATRHMAGCEFHDDDQYCCLETLVVQLGAKECVIAKVGAGIVLQACLNVPDVCGFGSAGKDSSEKVLCSAYVVKRV